MINRPSDNQYYCIKIPGYQVIERKAGKVMKFCETLEEARALIPRLMRKRK